LYKVTFEWDDREQQAWMNVYPGQVTYFTFRGDEGFLLGPPPAPPMEGLPTVSP
jgi:hypothetical protein